ncbi:MAG: hypothetical protein JW839_00335, partial [Candidatus Lokiarchaeota archaeon]|nr:hypothetical protein [Candidatus Lokiarchaeota archaeon]
MKLLPEKFKTGKYSGSPRDFDWYETLKTQPRGGEDFLEAWYSEDPEESEYLNDGFQRHIDEKLAALKQEGWNPSKQFAYCVSQSHLDLGWMWHFRQGVAKAETTFNKLHAHFKFFSPFTFAGSQPAQYQWVKLHDKDAWNGIVDDVARRRHEPQGGTWCEADGRMPSGEAWARHCLYGQLFYARNFGRVANIAWFPDSFGYANNLPQILAKGGLDSFFTTKLISNKETKWPFWAWTWRAPDGSTLTSYLTGISLKLGPFGRFHERQYDSDTVPESYKDSYKLLHPGQKLTCDYETDAVEKRPEVSGDDLPALGVFFGEGDGGHGPQGVEVATCRGMVDRGVATWSTAKEFFELVARWKARLPVWNDELYYEFHRGSLTTQTLMKRMNRFFEWRLPAVEGLCTIARLGNPGAPKISIETFYTGEHDQTPSARNAIEQVWQNVLLMQFHDVLPGTSIPEVYDECYEFWTQDKPLLDAVSREALQAIPKCHGMPDLGPLNVHFPLPMTVKVPGKETIAVERIVLVPAVIANATGITFCQAVEVPVDRLQGLLPFGAILDDGAGNMARVQLVPGDEICPDIDAKPARWIFPAYLPPWTTLVAWIVALPRGNDESKDPTALNTTSAAAFSALGGAADEKPACSASDVGGVLRITFPGGTVAINKGTGLLDRLDEGGTAFLKAPCGLKAYNDVPHREPCWNFQAGYWNHPKSIFDKPATVEVAESGPIRHVVRVTRPFGGGSRAVIDYSVVQGVEGIGVSIALDYHETETVVKYEIPLDLHATHSVAETCYATSKRRNKPEANRDAPRWEKWMHTFVTIESDDGAAGLAVINEGKYGFDTRGGNLGVSIVHGPRYPDTNIVAWARDERRKRKEAGLGEPPTHADQGPHLARLWLLPYHGSWRKGRVHHAAHGFNSGVQVLLLDGPKNARQTIGGREITVKILRSYIHDAYPKAAN